MLRTFSLLSQCRKIGSSIVISSRSSHRALFPLSRNINTKPLAITSAMKYYSTNPSAETTEQSVAPEDDTKNINWNTIYHFPSIMLTASVKRLKYYPMIFTGISVPVSLVLAYANIWSVTTAEIVGAIGFTTSLTLTLFGLLTDNLIGFVYCDDRLSKVKISFLDSKGKRQNRVYSIDDLVSRSELPRSFLKVYFPVKNHENGDVYKLVHQYGEIYDIHAFNKVFGHEVSSK